MLKPIARRIVSPRIWSFLSWSRDRLGVAATLRSLFRRSDGVIPVETSYGRVWLRPGTTDQDVCAQVLRTQWPEPDVNARFIIDAGAHIGMVTVRLAASCPHATIVAIEPELGNFAMLRRNTKRFGHVHAIRAALWDRETTLRVSNPAADTWSYRCSEGGDIAALTIPELMRRFKADRIDVLKLDVEGAEKAILEHSDAWIGRVGLLICETHDRYVPGCTEALERAIVGRGFTIIHGPPDFVARGPS